MHEDLTRAINDMIKDPKNIPMWLTSGITFVLSKGKDTEDPKNYCLIMCLHIIFKILLDALTNTIYNHLLNNNILPEQKDYQRMSRGCKA